jgi:hypothetical protein
LIIDSTKIGFNAGLRAARLGRAGVFVATQQPLRPLGERRIGHSGFIRLTVAWQLRREKKPHG